MTDPLITTQVACVVCGRGVLPHEMADGRCAMCLCEERDLACWERDEARKQGRCQCSDDDACRYARERDEAREENAQWREAWKRAAHYWRDRCMSALRQRTASSEEQEVNEDA